nr:MAG TPA: hypothetical protein [Caudoviricetes sp.]
MFIHGDQHLISVKNSHCMIHCFGVTTQPQTTLLR